MKSKENHQYLENEINRPLVDLEMTFDRPDVKMCYVITNLKVGACVKSKYGFGIYFNAPNLLNLFKFIFCQILSEFENSDLIFDILQFYIQSYRQNIFKYD